MALTNDWAIIANSCIENTICTQSEFPFLWPTILLYGPITDSFVSTYIEKGLITSKLIAQLLVVRNLKGLLSARYIEELLTAYLDDVYEYCWKNSRSIVNEVSTNFILENITKVDIAKFNLEDRASEFLDAYIAANCKSVNSEDLHPLSVLVALQQFNLKADQVIKYSKYYSVNEFVEYYKKRATVKLTLQLFEKGYFSESDIDNLLVHWPIDTTVIDCYATSRTWSDATISKRIWYKCRGITKEFISKYQKYLKVENLILNSYLKEDLENYYLKIIAEKAMATDSPDEIDLNLPLPYDYIYAHKDTLGLSREVGYVDNLTYSEIHSLEQYFNWYDLALYHRDDVNFLVEFQDNIDWYFFVSNTLVKLSDTGLPAELFCKLKLKHLETILDAYNPKVYTLFNIVEGYFNVDDLIYLLKTFESCSLYVIAFLGYIPYLPLTDLSIVYSFLKTFKHGAYLSNFYNSLVCRTDIDVELKVGLLQNKNVLGYLTKETANTLLQSMWLPEDIISKGADKFDMSLVLLTQPVSLDFIVKQKAYIDDITNIKYNPYLTKTEKLKSLLLLK